MRKVALIIFASLLIMGCRVGELTPEEKQKVASLQGEIAKIEKEISLNEASTNSNATGLIPVLQHARLETDKLTLAILRQQVAAIESGAKVTVVVPSTASDPRVVAALEAEIKDANNTLLATRAESDLYRGGIIKATIDARAAAEELTLASLKQKLLAVKYGLNLPSPQTDEPAGGQQSKKDQPNQSTAHKPDKAEALKVEDPGPFDFRRTRWGMSAEEVKQREQATFIGEEDGTIFYKDLLDGQKVTIAYLFVDGKLWRGAYLLDEKFSNDNKYVDAYLGIVSSLTEKYGKPTSEDTYWSKDHYKGRYEKRGMAYAVGDVETQADWDKEGTSIFAKIDGNDFTISVKVLYSSKDLEPLYREREKEKKQSKF